MTKTNNKNKNNSVKIYKMHSKHTVKNQKTTKISNLKSNILVMLLSHLIWEINKE